MSRGNAQSRGYDAKWQALQARHLRNNPYCARCGHPAQMVDHKVTVAKAPQLRLDPCNLQSLCLSCHAIKTKRMDCGQASGIMPDTDANGWPLDPAHPWNK